MAGKISQRRKEERIMVDETYKGLRIFREDHCARLSTRGSERQKKKILKQMVRESPQAFSGAPEHWLI